jgi:MFS transporter, FHS family, glucose/mannose:H+ symporter
MPRRSEVGLVYASGLIQGLALVTFPAANFIFTSARGFGFSASRYGTMFVPQVVLAILGSSLGPSLARRWTLKRVLQAGLAADLLAMTLLAASRLLIDRSDAAYGVLLVATGSLGFGFGAAVMAMNTFVQRFSPGREDRSVLALNALLGAGTALAPLFVAIFIGAGAWWLMPLLVAVVLAGLLLVSLGQPLDVSTGAPPGVSRSAHLPGRFWFYAAAVFLYGIAETLNGNWSGPYLTGEQGISIRGASVALMTFWAMVTIGRVLFATLSAPTTVRWIYAGLPVLLLTAFQIVARANSEAGSIVAFGLTGLGCSAFFPLCISLSGQEFPRLADTMSGGIVAFYQAGYGVAAFGVGPLRDVAGLPFRTIYSLGSLIAAAMFAVAIIVVTHSAQSSAQSGLQTWHVRRPKGHSRA